VHVPAGVPASDLEPADSNAKGAMMTAEGRFVVMRKRYVGSYCTLYSLRLDYVGSYCTLYSLRLDYVGSYCILYSLRLDYVGSYCILYSLRLDCATYVLSPHVKHRRRLCVEWYRDQPIRAETSGREVPPALKCPICLQLIRDAVAVPCCGTAFCDSCK
jgi:hypothetical protein